MRFRLAVSAAAVCAALCASAQAQLAVPAFSSDPGAPATLYLDFNGDFTASFGPYSNITTPDYDIDSDPTTFSAQELSNIQHIWSGVAEKYSPFNVNVTTVEPGNRNAGSVMAVDIGGDGSWTGSLAGGISSVGGYLSGYTTAFVFPANLANGTPKYTAEAAAHESGHGFGLVHQSIYDPVTGAKIAEYNNNGGSGSHIVATEPIMGVSYYATRGLWWYGQDTNGPTQYQDDLAVLSAAGPGTNNFGYRADDHPDVYTAADAVTAGPSNTISAHGIIEHVTDVDMFKFTTPGGLADILASVNADNAMLDLSMSILDGNGNIISTAATASLGEELKLSLVPGQYEIAISSADINYGDIGQYFISGTDAPEPASLGLFVCGSVLMLRRRAR